MTFCLNPKALLEHKLGKISNGARFITFPEAKGLPSFLFKSLPVSQALVLATLMADVRFAGRDPTGQPVGTSGASPFPARSLPGPDPILLHVTSGPKGQRVALRCPVNRGTRDGGWFV